MSLVFDPATHRYYDEQGELPSVTKILRAEGITPSYDGVDPFPALRGIYIHALCEAIDKDEPLELIKPPEGTALTPEDVEGYLDGYRAYMAESGAVWSHSELALSDPVYRYAGRIDRLPLLDIKTGAVGSGEPLQLAAYWGLAKMNNIASGNDGRFLYLMENGKYRLDTVKDVPRLHRIFLAVKTTYDYKRRK